jgi:hypothetical protein
MSVERFFRWRCDACSKEEVRHDYGLPAGWIAVKSMERITENRCESCKEAIPTKQRIIPQVVARK